MTLISSDSDPITYSLNTGAAPLDAGWTWTAGTGILAYDGIGIVGQSADHIFTLDDGSDTTDSDSTNVSIVDDWDNIKGSIIALSNPTLITTKTQLDADFLEFQNGFGITGDGLVYNVVGTGDMEMDLAGQTTELPYPMVIAGWDDVEIKAVSHSLVVQAGNDIGDLIGPNGANDSRMPRLPAGAHVWKMDVKGEWMLHGLYCHMNGIEGDFIVSRSQNADAFGAGLIAQILNIYCIGRVGGSGDQTHADFLQIQGGSGDPDGMFKYIFENITDISGHEGIVLSAHAGRSRVVIRNFSYQEDTTFHPVNWVGNFGQPLAGCFDLTVIDLDNFWYWRPESNFWACIIENCDPAAKTYYKSSTGAPPGSASDPPHLTVASTDIHYGIPTIPFSSPEKTGYNYDDPF